MEGFPKKVEMSVGGPLCEGFSLLNNFKDQEKSKLKNVLIVTFLSFCDTLPRKNTVSLVNWPKLRKYKCPELMKYKYNICPATGRFAQEEHRRSGELA